MLFLPGLCIQAKSKGTLEKTLHNLVKPRKLAWKMQEALETLLVSWTFQWVDWELLNTGLAVTQKGESSWKLVQSSGNI